jgi:FAD/FMN-containing dehydrogenase
MVNDRHSKLNPTTIKSSLRPTNLSQLVAAVKTARTTAESICIAGGRHAMGGQQFLNSGSLLDMSDMKRVLHFNDEKGLLEVEGGIFWPEIIEYLQTAQEGRQFQWAIAQKQTGCDRLSIGGALASNIHGRGLSRPPIVDDVENFTLVSADGQVLKCDRHNNSELFRLVIGGYGLFGVTSTTTLRLVPRTVLQRKVELAVADDVVAKLESRANEGAAYGDFQFAIDHQSPDFLKAGILSTYTPVETTKLVTENNLLSKEDWRDLLYLTHTDKSAAFAKYAQHYLSTNGQLYWSDTFQLATYFDDYHKELDERMSDNCTGTEMISELYVPRAQLGAFLASAAELLRDQRANVIYGTVRLIEQDNVSFLAWASQRWACAVFNLHVDHTPQGLAAASNSFSDLINLAIRYGGSYYLTYHRFAGSTQLLKCYPQFHQFLAYKAKYDPDEIFSSDWYQHYRRLLG